MPSGHRRSDTPATTVSGKTPFSRRLSTVGATLAMILCLSLVTGCKSELYSALPEQEANEMLAVLLSAGIDSEKFQVKQEFGIRVENKDIERAILLLQNKGYPRRTFMGVEEIFPPGGMISSTLEQQARLNYAMTQDLAKTITQIDGVIEARVHIAFAPKGVRPEAPMKHSAAVFIKYDPDYDLRALVPQIRNLVANSIADVAYTDVAVVLVESMPVALAPPGPNPVPLAIWLPAAVGAGVLIIIGGWLLYRRRYGVHRIAGRVDAGAAASPMTGIMGDPSAPSSPEAPLNDSSLNDSLRRESS